MTLNKFKLGELVEQYNSRCGSSNVTRNDISGVNRDKDFFPSNLVGENVDNYKVVPGGAFACNLMHVGRDIVLPIAYNHSNSPKFVSPAYNVFKVKKEAPLLDNYLEMWFKSNEKDRYFWQHTDSSVRDGLSWDDMCDIEIELPSIEIQQKFVDIYNAMVENQKVYESGLDDLKLACDGYIEDLRRRYKCEKIGNYIEEVNEKNDDNLIKEVRSISVTKEFKLTGAKVNKNELKSYLVVEPGQLAFVQTTGNEKVLACAYNNLGHSVVVSSVDKVIKSKCEGELDLRYLFLFLQRKEFDRYARFHSWGSAREVFTIYDMQDVEIPIPDVKIQRSISDVMEVYAERRSIANRLKNQLRAVCPILIKGSLEEARKA